MVAQGDVSEAPQRLLLLAIVIVVIGLIAVASPDWYSPDSAQYLSVTNHILEGRGFRTAALYYDHHFKHGLPALQTSWPPGLPLSAAAVALITRVDTVTAFAIVNAVAHGATSFLIYWLARKLGQRSCYAAVIAGVYLINLRGLQFALGAASEPLFCLAMAASAACLLKAFENDTPDETWLVAASLTVGGACLVRYQAAALLGGLGSMALIVFWRTGPSLKALRYSVCLLAPGAIVLAALLARNFLVSGVLTGGPTGAHGNSIGEVLQHFRWAILGYLGATTAWSDRFLIALMFGGLAGWIALALRRRYSWTLSDQRLALAIYGVSSAVLTVAMITGLSLRTTAYFFEGRYLLPCIVLGIVALLAVWPTEGHAAIMIPGRSESALRTIGLASLALLLTIKTIRPEQWPRQPLEIRADLAEQIGGRTVDSILREAASEATPVMSNQAQLLHIVLGKPTIGVPASHLTPNVWEPNDVVALARKFGVTYICLFKQMPDGKPDFMLSMKGNEPAGLTLVGDGPRIALYRVSK